MTLVTDAVLGPVVLPVDNPETGASLLRPEKCPSESRRMLRNKFQCRTKS